MLEKWFIVVLMFSANPELGSDVYVYKKPFETKTECYTHLKENSLTYFNWAYLSYEGRLVPDRANCIDGNLVKELHNSNMKNIGT